MATLAILLKTAHILMATVFFGTGLGVAWAKVRADRSADLVVVAWANQFVVTSDLVFTIPAGIAMPLTGLGLASVYGLPWTTPWILKGLAGWTVAGLFWVPAWRLQYRMHRLATEALAQGTPLPLAYHHANRLWLCLGVPSFAAALWTFWVMVGKG